MSRVARGRYFPWKEVAETIPEEVWATAKPGERLEKLKGFLKRSSGIDQTKIDGITESSMEQAFKMHVDPKERTKILALRSGQASERRKGKHIIPLRTFGFLCLSCA